MYKPIIKRLSHLVAVPTEVIAGWASRFLSLPLSVFNLKLIVEIAGVDQSAFYVVIFGLMPWIALVNIGIPVSVQNLIARYSYNKKFQEDLERTAVWLCFKLYAVCVPFSIILGILVKYVLLTENELDLRVIIFCVFAMSAYSISLTFSHLLYARHLNLYPNIYPSLPPIILFLSLFLISLLEVKSVEIILISASLSFLFTPLHALYLLKFDFIPSRIKIGELISASRGHFIFMLLSTATLSIDYVIISKLLSSKQLLEYSIISRIFLALLVFTSVVVASNWTDVSELVRKNKMYLARRRVLSLIRFNLIICIVGAVIILSISDMLLNWITNGAILVTDFKLAFLLSIYIMLRVWADAFTMGVHGAGHVNFINKFIPIQAILSVSLQFILGIQFGGVGIVTGICISFVLTSVWILPTKFYQITRSTL